MKSFGDMTLPVLRAECKKKGAKQDGRKKELVERLGFYEKYKNFGRKDDGIEKAFSLDVPDPSKYRDIHLDTPLPAVTGKLVEGYLLSVDADLKQVSKSLYDETFLQYCRWAAGDADDSYFVAARCRAQMKNGVTYLVNIQLDAIGAVLAAECECAAGMGPDAHCKHVAAVLYGLSVYKKEGMLKTEKTCTQKLQQFHATKKPHGGSPVKAANLSLPFSENIVRDPRPEQFRNRAGYNTFFLNTWKACPGVSRRPVSHLFEPANMYGFVHDHNYGETDYETDCLRNLRVHGLTEKGRQEIEKSTRGQASNFKWAAERTKRLHSSNFGRICKMPERTDARSFAEQLTQPSKLSTKPIQHGKRYEPEAVRKFSLCHKKEVSDCGIFVIVDHPFLAASPNGIIIENDGEMSVLEVKCPYSVKDEVISAKTVPYLVQTKSSLSLKGNHDYNYQVIGNCSPQRQKKLTLLSLPSKVWSSSTFLEMKHSLRTWSANFQLFSTVTSVMFCWKPTCTERTEGRRSWNLTRRMNVCVVLPMHSSRRSI